jgi:holliday junction DNA helicase RuvA
MIAYLEGNFIHKSPANIIIDVNGVGYDVNISLHTFGKIQNLKKGRLLTYLKVSEDSQSLFGFFDDIEKSLFLQLISISGVGAGTARVMLSGMQPTEIANAIASGDVKALERVKGIGGKTAQRIVLELKDKVSKMELNSSGVITTVHNNLKQDALNALISLGIAKSTADIAVSKVLHHQPDQNKIEEIIKLALKNI